MPARTVIQKKLHLNNKHRYIISISGITVLLFVRMLTSGARLLPSGALQFLKLGKCTGASVMEMTIL